MGFLSGIGKAIGGLAGGWPGVAAGVLGLFGGGGSSAPRYAPMDFNASPMSSPTFTMTANQRGGSAPMTAGFEDTYNKYIGQAMSGQGGLPESATTGALGTLNEIMNAQAQRQRATLSGAMGKRGMLDSGVYERGLADVGKAHAQNLASAANQFLQASLQQKAQAQQQAAQMYAGLKQARWNAELQARQQGLSQEQIDRAISSADRESMMQLANTWGQLYKQPTTATQNTMVSGLPYAGRTDSPPPSGFPPLSLEYQPPPADSMTLGYRPFTAGGA
jgi:hypothetical protein